MESPPTCSPLPGSPASCEPAVEWIGALEWSLNLDKWLHAGLGGWNEIWYSAAALTFKNIMGKIPDQPEVSGSFATDFIAARISPSLFHSPLCMGVQGQVLIVVPLEAVCQALWHCSLFSVLQFSGNSCLCLLRLGIGSQLISTAHTVLVVGELGGCGGVPFLQNVCSSGDFLGVLLLTASFGACFMWKRRIQPLPQTLTLVGCVYVLMPFIL